MSIFENIYRLVSATKSSNIYLYFITRSLKEGYKKRAKVLDKYDFNVYRVDINDEIREHLHELSIEQLNYLVFKDMEISEYDVISDDTSQIFTYAMKNKGLSFAPVLDRILSAKPISRIINLAALLETEELWAYCVEFVSSDKSTENILTFKKITPGKIAVDEREGNKRGVFGKTLRTIFNTKSRKLELIEGDTVNLDKQIDCIHYDNRFFIIHKHKFEQIVGIEEEFMEQANEVVTALEDTNLIEGISVLAAEFNTNPAIHRKLVKIEKIGNYSNLNISVIRKMQRVAKKFGETLKIREGKILIEDSADVSIVLKVLMDYYKLGEASGKSYGTYSGKLIDTQMD